MVLHWLSIHLSSVCPSICLFLEDTSVCLFLEDNSSKYQWIFTKLCMCIDVFKIWPQGYKTTVHLYMKFVLLINLRLLTVANSFLLSIAKLAIFLANIYENVNYFHIY